MKRTLTVAVLLGAMATMATAAEVFSDNTVGYKTLNVAGGNFNMLAVNWDEVQGGEISIQDLLDTSTLTGGTSVDDADVISVWDPLTSGYSNYFLYYETGMYAKPEWYGLWLKGSGPSTDTFPNGTAFWLRTRGVDTQQTLAGQVPEDTPVARTIYADNFTMIGSAFSADMPLNGTFDWLAAGATGGTSVDDADTISVWDPLTSGYSNYFLYYETGMYAKPEWYGLWLKGSGPTTDVLPLGQGAWYRCRSGSDFTWTEAKPY